MKKRIIIVLALMLVLSLAACGGGADNSAPPAGDTQNSGNSATTPPPLQDESGTPSNAGEAGQAMTSLIKWMMDGTFSYDFTMMSEGPDGRTESTGSMAMDGDRMAISTEMTVEGQAVKTRIIKHGETMYMIDDIQKFIMEISGSAQATEGMMTDYSGIVKTGDGMGEINGRSLPYEEYAEGDTNATVKYFLDGGNVYGIVSEYEGYKTTMIITNPSDKAPAGAFDLPTGYSDMGSFDTQGSAGSLEDYLPDGFETPDVELPEGFTLPEGIQLP